MYQCPNIPMSHLGTPPYPKLFGVVIIAHYNLCQIVCSPRVAFGAISCIICKSSCTSCKSSQLAQNPTEGRCKRRFCTYKNTTCTHAEGRTIYREVYGYFSLSFSSGDTSHHLRTVGRLNPSSRAHWLLLLFSGCAALQALTFSFSGFRPLPSRQLGVNAC